MDISRLREKQETMSAADMAEVVFEYFKLDRRKSAYDEPMQVADVSELYEFFFKRPLSDVSINCSPHAQTRNKLREAFDILEKKELIRQRGDGRYVLTALGYESNLDAGGGILILTEPEKKIQSLIGKCPNLDKVVAQYYEESLQAYQEGLYIASVICLGAASERAIHCLANAVVKRNPTLSNPIKKRKIDALTKYLHDNVIDSIFNGIANQNFIKTLKDRLYRVANVYRENRNSAGHPPDVPKTWTKRDQEACLLQFDDYIETMFEAIDIL